MRARRNVRGIAAWRMRRDASGALYQRLRLGFGQATRRTSACILAPHGRRIPSEPVRAPPVPPQRSVVVARAEAVVHLSQLNDRAVAIVEQYRRQAKSGMVKPPAFDSKQEVGLRG